MDAQFWHARWRTGQTGFHQSVATPLLLRHWRQLSLRPAPGVFVPLCGKSLDLLWLRDCGATVLGVELSMQAIEAFHQEQGVAARRQIRHGCEVFESAGLNVHCADFHALRPGMLGRIDAIYDRAALIAWPPAQQKNYVEQIAHLTSCGADTLLVTMEYPQQQFDGPPFSVDAAAVERLYGASHRIRQLSREDVLAHEPRLRARGITELHEACYHLTRL